MTTVTTRTIGTLDMAAFLAAHAAMRQEFGLLARVAASPADDEHAQLIEEQVALVLDMLHGHHTGEDTWIWPVLRQREPESADALDRLEAEHAEIAPLLAAAGDRSVPLTDRAGVLGRLHELINAHLDHEERVGVPMITRQMTPAEWEEIARRAVAEVDRKRAPLVFGWVASAAPPELLSAALADIPAIPRLLFRLFWWPAYQRRARRLYGSTAPSGALS